MKTLLALLLPPVAVLMCGKPVQALINVLLCCCLWVPGIVHALFVVQQQKNDRRIDGLVKSVGRFVVREGQRM